MITCSLWVNGSLSISYNSLSLSLFKYWYFSDSSAPDMLVSVLLLGVWKIPSIFVSSSDWSLMWITSFSSYGKDISGILIYCYSVSASFFSSGLWIYSETKNLLSILSLFEWSLMLLLSTSDFSTLFLVIFGIDLIRLALILIGLFLTPFYFEESELSIKLLTRTIFFGSLVAWFKIYIS